jgi:hypothetical protein
MNESLRPAACLSVCLYVCNKEDHLEDLDIGGRIIRIFEKENERVLTGFIYLRILTRGGLL